MKTLSNYLNPNICVNIVWKGMLIKINHKIVILSLVPKGGISHESDGAVGVMTMDRDGQLEPA